MTDHTTLRTLAEAATPGPWSVEQDRDVWELYVGRDGQHHGYKLIKAPKDDPEVECYWPSAADSTYLAACDPQTILALLDELETLRAALWELLATHGDPCRLGDDCPAVTMARAALAAGSGR